MFARGARQQTLRLFLRYSCAPGVGVERSGEAAGGSRCLRPGDSGLRLRLRHRASPPPAPRPVSIPAPGHDNLTRPVAATIPQLGMTFWSSMYGTYEDCSWESKKFGLLAGLVHLEKHMMPKFWNFCGYQAVIGFKDGGRLTAGLLQQQYDRLLKRRLHDREERNGQNKQHHQTTPITTPGQENTNTVAAAATTAKSTYQQQFLTWVVKQRSLAAVSYAYPSAVPVSEP